MAPLVRYEKFKNYLIISTLLKKISGILALGNPSEFKVTDAA